MLKKPTKRTMLWAATGVVALGIAVPAAAAYAADPTPSSSATAQRGTTGKGQDQQKLAAALAKELGLEEQKVADALAKVREQLRPEGKGQAKPEGAAADRTAKLKERLAQAVTDGKLTQAEADAILKASEAGVLNGGPGGGRRP